MDYRQALEYFRDRSDYDRGFISNPFAGDEAAAAGLRRTRLLADRLGSPDRAYPIIHVAGTKGKGSTCAFIESVARETGLKTGLFATPHLHTVRERVQINGRPLSEEAWAEATAELARDIAEIEQRRPELGRITAFEFNTVLALLAFERFGVEIGIVEVGLGGRLDATNIVEPAVSVITPISYDHQAILGETLGKIASEKAGIIKAGVPVVVAPQTPDALNMIVRRARELGAPIVHAESDWQTRYEDGVTTIAGPWGEIAGVTLGLRGRHQALNAGVALMALWQWSPGLFDGNQDVVAGLQSVHWIGRFEQVNASPTFVVDGAHNGASMRVLTETILEEFTKRDLIVIFGSYRDKDLAAMLGALEALDPLIIATRSMSPRALEPDAISVSARELGFDVVKRNTVENAIQTAVESAGPDTIIVACGSLSIAAEVREHFGLGEVSQLEREILTG